jgi:hypothetical protein
MCLAVNAPVVGAGRIVMPFKFHRNGRHHIPRRKFRVKNWRDDEAALRNRGSLTIWFTAEAIADWRAQPRATPGGQRRYSDLAIDTALTLRAVFGLALRQTEGLIGSIMQGRIPSPRASMQQGPYPRQIVVPGAGGTPNILGSGPFRHGRRFSVGR